MIYRRLGKQDFKVSSITFGAWAIGGWMWGGTDREDAIKALHEAVNLGMSSIDTAPIYGFGDSEKLVGEVIKNRRAKVQILTKFGLRWDTKKGLFYFKSKDNQGKEQKIHKYAGKESVIRECEDSLRRLQTDYIDLYQIHWPDVTTPVEETMEALEILLEQGKIRAAGVSNYSADLVKQASKVVNIASNQVPYSMLVKEIEKDVIPVCAQENIGILAYSPLQRGVLTGKITPGYHFNEGDTRAGSPFFKEPNLTRINNFLQQIKPIADERNITLAQLVINWALYRPGITSVLVGARNPDQVKENAGAVSFRLSTQEITIINQMLEELQLNFDNHM